MMDRNSPEYLHMKKSVKSKLDAYIEAELLSDFSEKYRSRSRWRYFMCAAAAAASAAVLLLLVLPELDRHEDVPVRWNECIASYGEKKSVTLPDGTRIWLHNDSRILYPDRFTGNTRQIFTSGEIYAEVTEDTKHPFVLSSHNVNVLVKGTTFNFRSYPETSEVELTLVEGAVDMDIKFANSEKTLQVNPGQIVKADLNDGDISRLSFSVEEYEPWKDSHAIYFNDESLEFIVAELERQFSIDIVVTDKDLLKQRYYASFVNCTDPLKILTSLNSANNRGHIRTRVEAGTYYVYSTKNN